MKKAFNSRQRVVICLTYVMIYDNYLAKYKWIILHWIVVNFFLFFFTNKQKYGNCEGTCSLTNINNTVKKFFIVATVTTCLYPSSVSKAIYRLSLGCPPQSASRWDPLQENNEQPGHRKGGRINLCPKTLVFLRFHLRW